MAFFFTYTINMYEETEERDSLEHKIKKYIFYYNFKIRIIILKTNICMRALGLSTASPGRPYSHTKYI